MDAGIVELAQQGDRQAYERLATDVAQRLYPVAYRVLRDRDLADDALQRTLVAIWRELPKLRQPASFEGWSYRMLVRFCGDELRKRRRIAIDVTSLDRFAGVEADDSAALADRDQLERAFRRLSADHRAVVVLTYFEGLTGAQVAERLGISAGTVASRLHYALRSLRAELEADARTAAAAETGR